MPFLHKVRFLLVPPQGSYRLRRTVRNTHLRLMPPQGSYRLRRIVRNTHLRLVPPQGSYRLRRIVRNTHLRLVPPQGSHFCVDKSDQKQLKGKPFRWVFPLRYPFLNDQRLPPLETAKTVVRGKIYCWPPPLETAKAIVRGRNVVIGCRL